MFRALLLYLHEAKQNSKACVVQTPETLEVLQFPKPYDL